jgi:hypothetical protein
MEKLNLVICGSRTITDHEKVTKVIESVTAGMQIDTIITGGARGVDEIAKDYAERKCIKHLEMKADWEKFGKAGGPIRNNHMAVMGNATLAIVDDSSVGTWNMIEHAIRWKHVNLTVFFFKKGLVMEYVNKIK